jgi:Ca2+-binding RTX toxin-like protein
VLDGEWGRDTLIGGSGSDTFEFYTAGGSRLGLQNADVVADFSVFQFDTIEISGGYFSRYFGAGQLDASKFCYFGQNYDGPHVIYHPGSGALYIDASTVDNTPAQVFAFLKPNTPLYAGAIWFS